MKQEKFIMFRPSVVLVLVLYIVSSVLSQEIVLQTQPSKSEMKVVIAKNYIVDCQGKGLSENDRNLLTDLRWEKDGEEIPQCKGGDPDVCTSSNIGSISLMIKNIQQENGGLYTCKGLYTGNIPVEVSQTLIVERDITWVNCPESQEVALGTSGLIQCQVLANPRAKVDWFDQNRNQIVNNKKFHIDGDGITLKNVSVNDAGSYYIEAKVTANGQYEDKTISLKVLVPPTITSPPKDVVAVETKEARLQCVAEGDPKPEITWLNEDRSDLQAITTDTYTVDQSTGDLIIKSVRKAQEGNYICLAKNSAGSREAEAKLTVVIMPNIQKFENLTVDQNNKAILKCASSGDPLPKITIKKVGDDVHENNDRVMTSIAKSDIDGWTVTQLTILNISRSDDGLYSCVAQNLGGRVEQKGHITVQHSPLMYETPSTEVITWQENPVNITCVARSIPNATIEWSFMGQDLKSNTRGFKIFGNGPFSVLNIEKPTQQYYGTYLCKAVNTLGTNQTSINLKEVFKPGNVQAILSKVTATTVTIKIVPPNNDGGTAITGYIGEYKEVSSPEWLVKKWNAVSDSFILEGLTPGKEYRFRFAAQNVVGTGQFIKELQRRMRDKAAPEPPSIITNSPSGVIFSPHSDKFRVAWSVPEDNGAAIKYYKISYCQVRNETGKWVKSSEFEHVDVPNDGSNRLIIDELLPETFYKVEIRAKNKLGYSQSSVAVYFRTAKDNGGGIKNQLSSVDRKNENKNLKTAEVVGIIIGILVIVLIIVDVSCCVRKKCGLTLFVCTKLRGDSKSDEKNKEFLEDGKLSTTEKGITEEVTTDVNDAVVAVDEKEPLRNGDKALEATNDDKAMMKGDKAKENEGLDVNSVDSDIKPPKDSAV